ncbi:MAG: hypothetical protein ACRD3P_17685 [Terriglobales bacterium]
MKRTDEMPVGWVKNPDPGFRKPDSISNRDEQPVTVPWCDECGMPMSLCRCDD